MPFRKKTAACGIRSKKFPRSGRYFSPPGKPHPFDPFLIRPTEKSIGMNHALLAILMPRPPVPAASVFFAAGAGAMKPKTRRIVSSSLLGWGFAVPAALFGIILARQLHLTNLSAAWITFGFFGLAGGAGFVLAIRAAGARATAAHALTLSGIWTPCLVASVIPLFYTMGTPIKMAAMSLFFFSLFGCIGGLSTTWLLGMTFPSADRRDLIPSAACWGIGIGAAAVLGAVVGSAAAGRLPEFGVWLAGFSAMAWGVGLTGACALIVFVKTPATIAASPDRNGRRRIDGAGAGLLFWTLLLLLPFYINDLADIYVGDWRLWLLIDYTAVKLLPLLILTWLIHTNRLTPEALGISGLPAASFAAVCYAAVLSGIFIDQNTMLLIGLVPGHARLGAMPEIANPLFARIDLTLGLMMVALCEELVFRGYLFALLRRFTNHSGAIVIVSAAAFGLIHWSGGIHRVVATGLTGAIFMMLYIRSRSLHPLIVAHFIIDFIDFSGLVPTDIFRYL
jgi:membrane protease YdiL (CAAX protease family)